MLAYSLPLAGCMKQAHEQPVATGNPANTRKWTCACAHPTHFLGTCQVKVEYPRTRCAECMQNHFTLNDDPTIAKH
jgi:hypothetical protein